MQDIVGLACAPLWYRMGAVPRLDARRRLAFVLVGAAVLSGVAPAPATAFRRLPRGSRVWHEMGLPAFRGVTVGPIESSQQPGKGYGTPYSAALLDELAAMGVNWISITPFGRLWSLGSTEILMDFEAPYEENRRAVRAIIRQAHARGIHVMVVPHLWVETEGWRGEVDPETPEGWEEYQASYRRFVMSWAEDAALAEADAFSIGVECKSWSGRFAPFWYGLIAEVRSVFPGWLTYSANWDEVENVTFWDALDLIGVNAFYPLAPHAGATDEEYRQGALSHVEPLRELAEWLETPVLFLEVGYTTRPDAAVEPWLWPDGMREVVFDEREQARALQATFDAFLPEDWFVGFFVWRYYANLDDVSQEAIWGFSPHAKRAELLLAEVFGDAWGVDADLWMAAPTVGRRPRGYIHAGLFAVP